MAFPLRHGLALAARPCQTRLRSPVWRPGAPHCPSAPRLGRRDARPRTKLGPALGLIHGGRVVRQGDRESRAFGHTVLGRMATSGRLTSFSPTSVPKSGSAPGGETDWGPVGTQPLDVLFDSQC